MKISFGAGLNENQFPQLSEAALGSYNFDLKKDSSYLFPRRPFDLLSTATNNSDIRGFLQLIKRNNTETTLVQAGNTVYKWNGGTTYSSTGTLVTSTCQLRDVYWSLGDYILTTDISKQQVVMKWDGASFTTATTGLASDLYAKYGIVHQGRMWFFNVRTSTDTPHLMVASAFEDPTSYDTTKRALTGTFVTGSEAFYMLTPDLKPINGVALSLSGDLIISTDKGRLYKLSGTGPSTYKWDEFYSQSGAIGSEALGSTGNDIMYLRYGGAIESLAATQNYGDVAADDISRWIPTTIGSITDAIFVYDQARQKVLWFTTGKVLVLFKDILFGGAVVNGKGEKAKLSPWSVYTTSHDSNFTTSAARYMRTPGGSTYTVFFGDSTGRVYNLNGTGTGGDGGTTDITLNRATRFLEADDGVNYIRKIPKARIRYERTKRCSLNLQIEWGDEYNTSTAAVILDGTTSSTGLAYYGTGYYYGGSSYYGTETAITGFKSHINTSFVGRGSVATLSVSSTNKVLYHVDHIELL